MVALAAGLSVVMTLCSPVTCNSYVVDSGLSKSDCKTALVYQADRMANVWRDPGKLAAFLAQFKVVEPASILTDYDYTCERMSQAYVVDSVEKPISGSIWKM